MPCCPVCKSDSLLVNHLSRDSIKSSLLMGTNVPMPADAIVSDYDIFRCTNCTLQYAWPLLPAEALFYDVLSRHPWYFPAERWEWSVVLKELAEKKHRSLLEVGCGSGTFLSSIPRGVRAIGLDLTPSVVADCRGRGLEVYQGTIEEFEKKEGLEIGPVDSVVAFHCLEHVADPLSFVSLMAAIVSPKGSIFVSTPYSPMTYERLWPDPLNGPPHHMTCWNRRSYEELARQLGLKARFFLPKPPSYLGRVLRSFALWGKSAITPRSRPGTLMKMALSPINVAHELHHQWFRDRIEGQVADNVVLVEFSKMASPSDPRSAPAALHASGAAARRGIFSALMCRAVSGARWGLWLILKTRLLQRFVSFGPMYISNLVVFER